MQAFSEFAEMQVFSGADDACTVHTTTIACSLHVLPILCNFNNLQQFTGGEVILEPIRPSLAKLLVIIKKKHHFGEVMVEDKDFLVGKNFDVVRHTPTYVVSYT
jgi:hypothetical protein